MESVCNEPVTATAIVSSYLLLLNRMCAAVSPSCCGLFLWYVLFYVDVSTASHLSNAVSSIATHAPDNVAEKEFNFRDDYDHVNDNLKYDAVRAMNHDRVPCSEVHEEMLPENTGNDFNIGDDAARASSSYIQPISHNVRNGALFLTELLLHNHMSGITASPFIANTETLQKSVSLHGIIVYSLSHDEYKSILLRHIFGGGCVQGPDNNDRTACHHFARGFNSPWKMTQFAFDVMSSAKSNQRSTDELLFLFRTLELKTAFKSHMLCRQIVCELKRQSKIFISSITAGEEFTGFEKLDRPTLLSIASSHQIQVDRFTGTKEDLKFAIISHLAHGECCHNVNEQ